MPDIDAKPNLTRSPASKSELFWAFTVLALQGFGGVLAVAQKELCDRREWLTHKDFLELLSTAQVLPGPNVCNLSLMIGDRFFGWRGALIALAGMTMAPMILLMCLAWLLGEASQVQAAQSVIKGALNGIAAVAAGQIIGTVLKLSAPMRQHELGWPFAIALSALALCLMVWVRLPLLWVLLGLGGIACLFTFYVLSHRRLRLPPSA